ncbi:hypothetical protein K1719_030945 [Acacia pycnantha]|nr:hypothetical protein K1719_030945 [Acacia pycnantha]
MLEGLRDCPLNYALNYLPSLLPPPVRKVVYLDSDLVIVDDIAELAATPMSSNQVLAAPRYWCSFDRIHASPDGSDIEHYIRKLLYDGEIKYNMNSKVLNFSMGKPRIMFNNNDLPPQEELE